MPDTPLLSLLNLSKSYREPEACTLLDKINWSLQAGKSYALLGPSGSGKSTLLHLIAGFDRPSEGELCFEGALREAFHKSSPQLRTWRYRNLGFLPQDSFLLADLTAWENILLPLKIRKGQSRPSQQEEQWANELLERLQVADKKNSLPYQLSRGQQHRIALTRALIYRPRLVLLDEPTGNLDDELSYVVQQLLSEYTHNFAMSLIIATHDQELANSCDEQWVLHKKQLHPQQLVPSQ